jgi:hypothetical protein
VAFDAQIAGITIYCEASDQGRQGREAIAWTLRNRLADGRFGSTIAEVCLRRFQFSEWNGDARNNANLLRAARVPDGDLILGDCLRAFSDVLAGRISDPTGGATHYHEHAMARFPDWTIGAIKTATIAAWFFYRGVR